MSGKNGGDGEGSGKVGGEECEVLLCEVRDNRPRYPMIGV